MALKSVIYTCQVVLVVLNQDSFGSQFTGYNCSSHILISTSHQLNGHEFQQMARDSEGQRSLACCGPWGLYKLDTTERQHLCLCQWGENTAVNVTISLIDRFLIVKLAFCCKHLLNSCEYCQ